MYQFDGNDWEDSHLEMKERRQYHSCVLLDGEIIVVGGEYRAMYLKTSEIFSLESNSWRSGPVLRTGIYGAQLVKAREGMKYAAYLIGGYDGSLPSIYPYLTSIYGLSKDLLRFEKIGDLKKARAYHVALSIPDNIIQKCDKT